MTTRKFYELFDWGKKSTIKAGEGQYDGNFPFYTSSSVLSKRIDKAQYYEETLIFGTGGSASIHYAGEPFSTSTDCIVALRKQELLSVKFVYYYLFGNIQILERGFKGAGLKHISKTYIEELDIPVFPLETQNKIVAILDKATALVEKRQKSSQLLDELLQATFLEMFGDPILNPLKWPVKNLEESVLIMRDGPFGSNLKTEHYTNSGVRVIRLQNIGVNKFLNDDIEFISESHANFLKKHICQPGDVLVGTLGEPNLRACKFPVFLERAINKADCVQIRPDYNIANDSYLTFLLNHPSSLFLVKNYIKGQTRSRISKGMLSKIDIPIPPIELQNKFSLIESKYHEIKQSLNPNHIQSFIKAISGRIFNAQLIFNIDAELDSAINDIDIEASDNNISVISNDKVFVQRLIDKLAAKEYSDIDMYNKAKYVLLKALKQNKNIEQEYDEPSQSVKLSLK